MKYFIIFISFTLIALSNPKYLKWQVPSFFRGYNVLYETPKTEQDFIDFRNYGGNFFHIQTDGFLSEDPPYNLIQSNIDLTDSLVTYCRRAGLYYAIGVRSGPGAYDTYDESIGLTGESRIWETGNLTEQQLYADMLRMIVERYKSDTLFIGINLVIEPRPKVRQIPANNSELYKLILENVFNIRMDNVYHFFISEIRKSDPYIPVIIENFAYSTPELFPAYVINDPYVVYSYHNYQPSEYTKSETRYSVTYPGIYWNITYLSQQLYNKQFFEQTVFKRVELFQEITGAPVFMGEFGILLPQFGSPDYITDILEICRVKGWHFALWDWRRRQGEFWNIEGFQGDSSKTWSGVLENFHAPPVPGLISPENGDTVSGSAINFIWDSLTAFTRYDLIITDMSNNIVIEKYSLPRSRFTYNHNLLSGLYKWKVRSKNPGGLASNYSDWSVEYLFYISGITNITQEKILYQFSLKGNYPNPFNPETKILFTSGKNCIFVLKIYDINGKYVYKTSKYCNAGENEFIFRADNLASGTYFYSLEAMSESGDILFSKASRMVIIK